jgi:hypothetical protein
MIQQVMILLKNHEYKVSQPIHYRSDTSITSEQNFVDLMTQHMTEEIFSVDNDESSNQLVLSKEPSAISIDLLS